jgi:hypothetical protein
MFDDQEQPSFLGRIGSSLVGGYQAVKGKLGMGGSDEPSIEDMFDYRYPGLMSQVNEVCPNVSIANKPKITLESLTKDIRDYVMGYMETEEQTDFLYSIREFEQHTDFIPKWMIAMGMFRSLTGHVKQKYSEMQESKIAFLKKMVTSRLLEKMNNLIVGLDGCADGLGKQMLELLLAHCASNSCEREELIPILAKQYRIANDVYDNFPKQDDSYFDRQTPKNDYFQQQPKKPHNKVQSTDETISRKHREVNQKLENMFIVLKQSIENAKNTPLKMPSNPPQPTGMTAQSYQQPHQQQYQHSYDSSIDNSSSSIQNSDDLSDIDDFW